MMIRTTDMCVDADREDIQLMLKCCTIKIKVLFILLMLIALEHSLGVILFHMRSIYTHMVNHL